MWLDYLYIDMRQVNGSLLADKHIFNRRHHFSLEYSDGMVVH
jgi:hypothetical protein